MGPGRHWCAAGTFSPRPEGGLPGGLHRRVLAERYRLTGIGLRTSGVHGFGSWVAVTLPPHPPPTRAPADDFAPVTYERTTIGVADALVSCLPATFILWALRPSGGQLGGMLAQKEVVLGWGKEGVSLCVNAHVRLFACRHACLSLTWNSMSTFWCACFWCLLKLAMCLVAGVVVLDHVCGRGSPPAPALWTQASDPIPPSASSI